MSHTPNVPKRPVKTTPSFVLPAVIGLVGFTALGLFWVQQGVSAVNTAELLPLPESPSYAEIMNEAAKAETPKATKALVALSAPPRPAVVRTYTAAQALQEIMPQYPRMAKLVRIQGPVDVDLKVDERGHPIEAKALNGNTLLQAEALKAAQAWRFIPASRNGHAVASDFRVRFNFRLS